VYERFSGLLILEKTYKSINVPLNLVPGFFVAIKSFFSEVFEKSNRRDMAIQYDDHVLVIMSVKDIDVDVIIICDREDMYFVESVLPELDRIILKYQRFFDVFAKKCTIEDEIELIIVDISRLIESQNNISNPYSGIIEFREGITRSSIIRSINIGE
jgi:hypothetical protein